MAPFFLLTLTAIFLSLSPTILCRFVVEKSNIRVLAPEHIRAKHDGAIANFGVPDYGGTMIGVVLYPSKGTNGCNPFVGSAFKSKSKRSVVLLLDRGAGVLTASLISFRQGNSQLGQKLMRARVVAQGVTVALMVGSPYYYGQFKASKKDEV